MKTLCMGLVQNNVHVASQRAWFSESHDMQSHAIMLAEEPTEHATQVLSYWYREAGAEEAPDSGDLYEDFLRDALQIDSMCA